MAGWGVATKSVVAGMQTSKTRRYVLCDQIYKSNHLRNDNNTNFVGYSPFSQIQSYMYRQNCLCDARI